MAHVRHRRGGPTAWKLAGALAEIARTRCATISGGSIRPRRAFSSSKVPSASCPSYPPALSVHAERTLARLGVEVRVRHPGDRDRRRSGHALRAAARNGEPASGQANACRRARPCGRPEFRLALRARARRADGGRAGSRRPRDRPARISRCRLIPRSSVIGDLACYPAQHGETLPGVAQVAMQQGRHCGGGHRAGAPAGNRARGGRSATAIWAAWRSSDRGRDRRFRLAPARGRLGLARLALRALDGAHRLREPPPRLHPVGLELHDVDRGAAAHHRREPAGPLPASRRSPCSTDRAGHLSSVYARERRCGGDASREDRG